MNIVKEKALKLAEAIRKQERQDMMISRRNWHEMPSPVFQLPHRIEHGQWDHFESALDTICQKNNPDLVQESLKQYLFQQWQRITEPAWQSESSINIIRVLFRLRIANRHHGRQLLEMGVNARREAGQQLQAGEALLKIVKELAISLEATANTISEDKDIWKGELNDQLNSFVSTLSICRVAVEHPQFRRILREQKLYYLVLLADQRVSIDPFMRMDNIGELFLLISDSLDQRDNFHLKKTIQIIKKMLRAANNEETDRILQGLSVLCISGIEAAMCFLQGKTTQNKRNSHFFYRFITIAGNADAGTLLQATHLLALLFSRFDECIPAAFAVNIQPIQYDDPEGVQVMRPRQHYTLTSLLESLLEHLLIDIRVNGYWTISNITGSALYFRQHGLSLIRHIYINDFLHMEGKQIVIQEITFCVLNYLCNITRQEEVEELSEITILEEGKTPTCLLFCIQVAADMLQNMAYTSDFRSILSEQYFGIIRRAVFALQVVLQQAGPLTELIRCHLQRKGLEAHLELLRDKLSGEQQLSNSISVLMSSLESKESPL